jgi:lipopolysaccharide export system protein LptC
MSSPIRAGTASAAEKLARQASFRVTISKYLGFTAIIIGLVVFGAFLVQSGFFENFVSKPAPVIEKIEHPTLISGTESHISGIDKDQQPYEITAQKGIQDQSSGSLVHLQEVTGVFHRPNNKQINLVSQTALYDSKTKVMDLAGDVIFEEPGRYKARMQKAKVNLDDKSLVSQSPVHVDLATGSVEADSLEIMDNGKRSLFKGRVKAKFETKTGSGGNE